MFLFGISSAGEGRPYVMTRIFRKMRDLRMTYTLEISEQIDSSSDSSVLAKRLSTVYGDRTFVIINPRFSQVGRPTVKVEMRPRLFVIAPDPDKHALCSQVSGILRKALIPVESVIIHDGDSWQNDDGRGFGGDYSGPVTDILTFLKKIDSEGRLRFNEGYNMPEIREIVSSATLPDDDILRAAILSVAVPLWFGEHKKQLKTHSAGGRVQI